MCYRTTTSQKWVRPGVVSGGDQFCACQPVERGKRVTPKRCAGKGGLLPRTIWHKRGGLSKVTVSVLLGETSVGTYKLEETIEKS